MGRFLVRQYHESNYFIYFDRETGFSLRSSLTGEDPFWNRRGPEFLDISITNFCERGCCFCYRASNPNGTFMSLTMYESIIKQAENAGVMQVALGGGNPNQHPQFTEILQITKEHHIIPSYTTNGQGMSDKIYDATKKYCGAIAVSWYEPFVDAPKVIEQCRIRGIKVNIHYLLHRENIRAAANLLRSRADWLDQVNAVIFLNYKPIHSQQSLCLEDNEDLDAFLSAVHEHKGYKLGFDSCMVSYLVKFDDSLSYETLEFCEAGRFSAFISEKGLMYPCSFLHDTDCSGIDLTQSSLEQGWQYGMSFQIIRTQLSTPSAQQYPIDSCAYCSKYTVCRGGCPKFPINRCREI